MLDTILTETQRLIDEGGWVFIGLIALAFGISFALMSIYHYLQLPGAPYLQSREWRRLLRESHLSRPLLDQLIGSLPSRDPEAGMRQVEQELFAVLQRRIPFAFVLIGAAPLVGLLGTVAGMFTTFSGMSTSSVAAPVDVISRGVSEALITTQAGLVIGVPAFIACTMLSSYFHSLRTGFQQVRSAVAQRCQDASA